MKIMPLSEIGGVWVEDSTGRCVIFVQDKLPTQLEVRFPDSDYFKFVYDNEEKNYKLLISKNTIFQEKPKSMSDLEWKKVVRASGKRYKILKEKLKDA